MPDWPSSRDGDVLVASADAPLSIKRVAHYVCDGTDDHEEINAAVLSLPAGAEDYVTVPSVGVRLSGGHFWPNRTCLIQRDRMAFWGAGRGASIINRGPSWLTVATPAAPTLTPSSSGGTLAAGTTYNYRIVAVTAAGHTLAGPAAGANATTTGSTSSIAVTWTAVTGAIAYRVYGRLAGAQTYVVEVATNSWTDTGALTPGESWWGAVPAADCASPLMAVNRFDKTGLQYRRTALFVDIAHFTLRGGFVGTQGLMDGMVLRASRSEVHDLEITQCNSRGIRVLGTEKIDTNNFATWACYGLEIKNNKIYENGQGGIYWGNYSGDSGASFCEIYENAGPGMDVGDVVSWIGPANFVWGNRDNGTDATNFPGCGMRLRSTAGRFPIFGNKLEQNRHGILIQGGFTNIIMTNKINSNSNARTGASDSGGPSGWYAASAALNQCDDIHIASGGSSIISGNLFQPDVYPSDKSRYAINFQGGDEIQARSNQYNGTWGTARINIAGGATGHFDFEPLRLYHDLGTVTTTQTPDPMNGELQLMTLGANITMNAPSFARTGMKLRFHIAQDATGGRTITWNAAYDLGSWKHKLSASSRSEIGFIYNGTVWVAGDDSPPVLTGTATWDPANMTTGTTDTPGTNVTVTGARVGDPAIASLTTLTDAKWIISAHVTANDTVRVTIRNETGGTVNLSSGTLNVIVFKR